MPRPVSDHSPRTDFFNYLLDSRRFAATLPYLFYVCILFCDPKGLMYIPKSTQISSSCRGFKSRSFDSKMENSFFSYLNSFNDDNLSVKDNILQIIILKNNADFLNNASLFLDGLSEYIQFSFQFVFFLNKERHHHSSTFFQFPHFSITKNHKRFSGEFGSFFFSKSFSRKCEVIPAAQVGRHGPSLAYPSKLVRQHAATTSKQVIMLSFYLFKDPFTPRI